MSAGADITNTFLVIAGCVAGQLEDFSGKIFKDSGEID
jgi:hypothetical protein